MRIPGSSKVTPGRGWTQVLAFLDRGTILVLGAPGSGKTTLARWFLGQLDRGLDRVALVDCDPGQTAVGVPGCMGLAMTGPWEAPAALWFVGSKSPAGRLLPAVVGAAMLAARARERGAQAVLVDSSGLVEGTAGRLLKVHLAHATGVDQVVALERQHELAPLLSLLSGEGRKVDRVQVSKVARERTAAQRRRHREDRFAAHFQGATTRMFSPRRLFTSDWRVAPRHDLPEGRVVGLLDGEGFCLGLGIIEEVHADRVAVLTPVKDVPVVRIQAADFRIDPEGRELAEEEEPLEAEEDVPREDPEEGRRQSRSGDRNGEPLEGSPDAAPGGGGSSALPGEGRGEEHDGES